MLDKKILDLAQTSYAASLNERRTELIRQVGQLQSEAARKGVVGGPMAATFAKMGADEVSARSTIVIDELKRAAESYGVRAYKELSDDLLAAYDNLTSNQFGDVETAVLQAMKPHAPNHDGAKKNLEFALQQARSGARTKATAELEHFAATRGTQEREKMARLRERIGLTVIGTVLGAIVTLIVQHFSH